MTTFLIIEGASDNASIDSLVHAKKERRIAPRFLPVDQGQTKILFHSWWKFYRSPGRRGMSVGRRTIFATMSYTSKRLISNLIWEAVYMLMISRWVIESRFVGGTPEDNWSRVNTKQTQIIAFRRKRAFQDHIQLTFADHRDISLAIEVKYIGDTCDQKLKLNPHFKKKNVIIALCRC